MLHQEMQNIMQPLKDARGEHDISPVVAEMVTDESLEILRHFGYETPKLLNDYSNALEDKLIDVIKMMNEVRKENMMLRAQMRQLTLGDEVEA